MTTLTNSYRPELLRICLITLLFVIPVLLRAQERKKMMVNVSIPVVVGVTDIYVNADEKFDNSVDEFQRYLNINATFDKVVFEGRNFYGISISDEFFSYRQIVQMNGEMSDDMKTIKRVAISLYYTIPTDYSFEWWVREDMKIYFLIESIPYSYGSFSLSQPQVQVKQVEYELKRFEQRLYDRYDQYEELMIRTNFSKSTPVGGSISIIDNKQTFGKPVDVSITHDGDKRSKELAGYIEGLFFETLRTGEVHMYERGEYYEALLQEALLGTSDLANPDYQLNIETIMENYFKEMDVAVRVSTEEIISENKEWKQIVTIITPEQTLLFEYMFRHETKAWFIAAQIAIPLFKIIDQVREAKAE